MPGDLSLDLLASPAQRAADAPSRLNTELIWDRLSRLLDCPVEEVAARRTQAASDWRGWVRRLFDDADIDGLIMDPAWSGDASVAPYAELAGRPVWELYRIEPLVDDLVAAGAEAGEIVDRVTVASADAVARGCVGLKTVIAYRTGLAVDPEASRAAAEASLRDTLPVRRRGKALRDLLLRSLLGLCADLAVPIQVHAGFGDSDIRPRDSDPLLLDGLLRTPEGRRAQIVVIHGSWPWYDALGYLTAVHANVWAEFSLAQLFAPLHTADRLLRLLDLAPTNRILLGSDGHGSPESIWFGCRILREAWPEVRDRLVSAGARPGWVDGVRHAVFSGNAARVYPLDRSAPGR